MTYMPDELVRFIQRDTYSLLIKGLAGTGKTTLALTILRALESKSNFFYISTRISPKQLFQYYSWLGEFVGAPGVDGSSAAGGSERHKLPLSSFEDARLDEPESLFERITNQLMDIKSPVIIIDSWDAIASFMDKEARLNNERVLQTWRERAGAKLIFISEHPADTTLDFLVDGIVELKQRYHGEIRVREILLLKLRGVRIDRPSYIYTLEGSTFRSFLPYRPLPPNPALRGRLASTGQELVLQRPSPSSSTLPSSTSRPHDQPSLISTGYGSLDAALGGGLPRKGVVLLELDQHVNTMVAATFLGRLVSNFLASGNPVLLQPFDRVEPASIVSYLSPYLPAKLKKDLFKILWISAGRLPASASTSASAAAAATATARVSYGGHGSKKAKKKVRGGGGEEGKGKEEGEREEERGEDLSEYIMAVAMRGSSRRPPRSPAAGAAGADPSLAAIHKMRQMHRGKLLLNIMGVDMLQKFYSSPCRDNDDDTRGDLRIGIERLLSSAKASADLSVAVVRTSDEEVLKNFSEVSDMHMKLLMINGTLLLQSIIPQSTLYSVTFDKTGTKGDSDDDTSNGAYQVNLEAVV